MWFGTTKYIDLNIWHPSCMRKHEDPFLHVYTDVWGFPVIFRLDNNIVALNSQWQKILKSTCSTFFLALSDSDITWRKELSILLWWQFCKSELQEHLKCNDGSQYVEIQWYTEVCEQGDSLSINRMDIWVIGLMPVETANQEPERAWSCEYMGTCNVAQCISRSI